MFCLNFIDRYEDGTTTKTHEFLWNKFSPVLNMTPFLLWSILLTFWDMQRKRRSCFDWKLNWKKRCVCCGLLWCDKRWDYRECRSTCRSCSGTILAHEGLSGNVFAYEGLLGEVFVCCPSIQIPPCEVFSGSVQAFRVLRVKSLMPNCLYQHSSCHGLHGVGKDIMSLEFIVFRYSDLWCC
jgi:hypothetical protein